VRIALIADSHFDETSRLSECVRVHEWIADDIASRDVELVLHSGDVYERRSTPTERQAVADWLHRVASVAPVVIVRGNHDVVADLALLERLRTSHPIRVEEGAGVHLVAGAAVACLAWPRKAELLARIEQDQGAAPEASSGIAASALRDVLRDMGMRLADHDGPRLLLAHAMVRGSVTSTGQPLVGCDMELGLDDLALVRAHVIALGHIHRGQDWQFDGAPVIYPGSPRRSNFGELESKGYVILDFDGARLLGWERIETPCTPMIHVDARWKNGPSWESVVGIDDWSQTKGAEVRFRYSVASDQRDAAKAEAEISRDDMIEAGAVSIKVEEIVEAKAHARAPEIAAAPTLPEKLTALWNARHEDLGERSERLIDKANELERDASA
jgi:exonuclease SbcD